MSQVKHHCPSSSMPDLQHISLGEEPSNSLTEQSNKGVAASVCNTLYVCTNDGMHALHADVGLTVPDVEPHIRDIENMTEAALKKAYSKEHNSWRARRDTAKKESLPWSPDFDKFSEFLRIVGPKPKPDYQLDKRIKEYGYVPDNVRWVSPAENVVNRDATRLLTYKGETHPVSIWAKKYNTPKSTIFGRLRRGWFVSEAITGDKENPSISSHSSQDERKAWSYTPWPVDKRIPFEKLYQENGKWGETRLEYYLRRSANMMSQIQIRCCEELPPDDEFHTPTKEQADEKVRLLKIYDQNKAFHDDAMAKLNASLLGAIPPSYAAKAPDKMEAILLRLSSHPPK